jgi:mono/diheme cytochrome c family protein
MEDKGIGPIKSVTLGPIDEAMVAKGKEVYDSMCTACHKVEKRFIGPSPAGILDRRTPEWIMNMILDPDKMVKENAQARELLAEYMAPMANQNLTEEQARAVLEYFRTLN